MLSLGPNEAALTSMPGFDAADLQPGPAAVGVQETTRVARMDVYLNSNVHVGEDDVYRVVRSFHLHWTELQEALPAFRSVRPDDIAPLNIGHPYHDGAIRYYREIGLWTEAHERLLASLGATDLGRRRTVARGACGNDRRHGRRRFRPVQTGGRTAVDGIDGRQIRQADRTSSDNAAAGHGDV